MLVTSLTHPLSSDPGILYLLTPTRRARRAMDFTNFGQDLQDICLGLFTEGNEGNKGVRIQLRSLDYRARYLKNVILCKGEVS